MSRIAQLLGITVFTLYTVTACGGLGPEESERGTFQLPQGAGKADGNFTCEGSCGDMAVSGCWCDARCAFHGDCCPDVNEVCANADDSPDPEGSPDPQPEPQPEPTGDPQPEPTSAPCHGICTWNARCSDFCPQGASCVQMYDDGPTYWLITSCGVYDYGDGFYWF